MSNFIVLGDSAVKEILLNLSKSEITSIQHKLEESLIEFSVGSERGYQPNPSAFVRPDGQKTLFRPFTSPTAVGTKIIVHPAPVSAALESSLLQTTGPSNNAQQLPLHGILAICDRSGHPIGVINAEEVTGCRTSLSTMIPYVRRRKTANIVIFGAGKQALWHIRLALALRGPEIKAITVINRSEARAETLISSIKAENQKLWKSLCKFAFLDSSQSGYDQHLKALISAADVIFCTVPSQQPLFPLRFLTCGDNEEGFPFIAAIGSWQPDMIELDPDILRYVVKTSGFSLDEGTMGIVLVDDRQQAKIHAGEIIQSGLSSEQMTDIGQILAWQREDSDIDPVLKRKLFIWLKEGFVVYKSVGVSIADLVVGTSILSIAEERKIGVSISDF